VIAAVHDDALTPDFAEQNRRLASMSDQARGIRHRRMPPLRNAALALALALSALLLAACDGSGTPSSAGQPATLAQTLSDYAACMHHHGLPAFYWKHLPPGPPPPGMVLAFHGYAEQGFDRNSAIFHAASNTCAHKFPLGTPPTPAELHQQFMASLKTARCMRTHGFPGWPDPTVVNGRVPNYIPTGIDTSSPQFIAAQKACNP
jgi:hypothetical protein